MKNIYYASIGDMNLLGAVKSSDPPLIKNLSALNFQVVWFGSGLENYQYFGVENIEVEKKYFIKRVRNKLFRQLKLESIEEQVFKNYIDFDLRVKQALKERKEVMNQGDYFIGRGCSSEFSFQLIKQIGGSCVLNSQWEHPLSQKKILDEEFRRLGIIHAPISEERIEKQLREIELSDQIWCYSNSVYESYLNNGVSEEKLFLCPLGVDTDLFKPDKNQQNEKGDKFRIIFVGNINIEKGAHILLDSLTSDKIRDCELFILGSTPEYFRPILKKYINILEAKNIKVFTQLEHPLKLLQSSDVFILPSFHDSFGLSVLEAMACGLPVIVTNGVGSSDLVSHNNNGFITQVGSKEEILQKILYLQRDKEAKNSFGLESIRIAKNYDWSLVAKRLTHILEMDANKEK